MDACDLFDILEEKGCEPRSAIGRMMDNEEFYLRYLVQIPNNENYDSFLKHIESGDCTLAERAIHSMKGMALNLGLLPVSDIAVDIISDLRAGELESAKSKIPEFAQVYSDISKDILSYGSSSAKK